MINLTQTRLKELLKYSQETGEFTWVDTRNHNVKIGDVAGQHSQDYVRIKIDRKTYLAHRLAWLYAYGEWPQGEIDHINHVRSDNRLSNLRDVSRKINSQNRVIPSDNKSGVMGVTWSKADKKWQSTIGARKTYKYLGIYVEWWDAVCARKSAEHERKYHSNHGRLVA